MKISVFACFVLIYANLDHYGVTAWKPTMTPAVEELLIQEGNELRLSCQGEGRLQFSSPSYLQLKVKQSNFTGSFEEGSNTYTFIRPKTISGDTGWYACAEEKIWIVNDEQTIDHPGEAITWIYVYVNSSRLFTTEKNGYDVVYGWSGNSTVIPCRTTSPNLPVILVRERHDIWQLKETYYDPKIGFILNDIPAVPETFFYQCEINGTDMRNINLWPKYRLVIAKRGLQNPIIKKDTIRHVVWGEDLTLYCTVKVPRGMKILMNWTVPDSVSVSFSDASKVEPALFLAKSGEYTFSTINGLTPINYMTANAYLHFHTLRVAIQQRLYYPKTPEQLFPNIIMIAPIDTWKAELTLKNVSKTDSGEYICVATDGYGDRAESSVEIEFWDPSYTFINVSMDYDQSRVESVGEWVNWGMTIDTYPLIYELYWYNPDGIRIYVTGKDSRYKHERSGTHHYFSIERLVIEDSGNYTVHVSTSHNETRIILPLTVLKEGPYVYMKDTLFYSAPNASHEFRCDITSQSLPNVTWTYKEYPDFPSKENVVHISPSNITGEVWNKLYKGLFSRVNITINMTGDLVCSSCNVNNCTEKTVQILVSDIAQRLGVVGPHIVTEGDDFDLTCGASVYDFTDRIWWIHSDNIERSIVNNHTKFTYRSVLEMRNVTRFDHRIQMCEAYSQNNRIETVIHELIVEEALPPQFTTTLSKNNSEMLIDLRRKEIQTVLLECLADGRPIPKITWRKNRDILVEDDRHKLLQNNFVLEIKNVSESDGGTYTCYVTNRVGEIQKYTVIKIAEAESYIVIWPIVIVAVVLLVIMVAWMSIRKRREMASRRKFMEATLQRFNAGALDCLDPELNMAEQAELLPYNKKWEFPRELLKFDKELGSGAFGVVKMAQAKSICRSEAVTTVAVKVVRSTANLNHMTALQRELKILAYLGKHLNVVNLLGACTKHVSYGQLLVIVEFCRFGNLRDYLVRHRADFVGRTDNVTEDIDTDSSDAEDHDAAGNNGVVRASCDVSTATAVFLRGTDSTNRSPAVVDRVPEPGTLKPSQRINYQGDYEDENLEPISTRDLLSWAWQVARGMKFLGLRRILHGDLAARNILLADHNVVKICDFGLAKTLFTDDNYQQKGNGPLPYKWMAIESLKDRVFSVHSDVWSYGVVLWEFYSLAKTPYSAIRPETLHAELAEGFRMARPEHATPEIYQMMLHCWNTEPFQRPSFAKLVEDISHLLEDSVKTHYFDLTESYVQITADAPEHAEPDYLTMNTSEVVANPNEQSQA